MRRNRHRTSLCKKCKRPLSFTLYCEQCQIKTTVEEGAAAVSSITGPPRTRPLKANPARHHWVGLCTSCQAPLTRTGACTRCQKQL